MSLYHWISMNRVELACLRSKPQLVGKGVYRRVYRLGKFALKVGRPTWGTEIREHANQINVHNQRISSELPFVPNFYGTIITAEKRGERWLPVIVTFHEFVQPLPLNSARNLRAMIRLVGEAADHGYVLDIKPSNFGKKGNRVYYLDERGVGKGPIPPDVFEDLSNILKSFIELSKKVSRSHVRLSRKQRPDI